MKPKLRNHEVARRFDEAAARYDHLSNPYTVQRRADALASFANGRCLEFGGGTGAISARLADRPQVVHSDISPRMCVVARRKLGCPSVCLDAETIPVASDSLDTALGAEMIYYLEHPRRFAAEVYRVLRPGGSFLFADIKRHINLDELYGPLHRCGLTVIEEEDITANVIRARDLDHHQRMAFIRDRAPQWLVNPIGEFGGLKGSRIYNEFRRREVVYKRFVLQKPAA